MNSTHQSLDNIEFKIVTFASVWKAFPAQTTNSADSCVSRASTLSSSRRKCFLAMHSKLYVISHLTHRRLIKPK